jgi:phosphohistidine phosphatase
MRALNARGRAAAPVMGAFIDRHDLLPDLAYVSTAERTRETWALIAPHLHKVPKVVFEDRLYDAAPGRILDIIRDAPRAAATVLVVGHNPGLHRLAIELTGTGDLDARARLIEKFPTAALAVISFAADGWIGVRAQAGRLERFVSPSALVEEPD